MIITFREIKGINQLLDKVNLNYKIHLSDACGSQSMWIESLNGAPEPQTNPELYLVIDAFFKELGIDLTYTWDKKSFWSTDRSLIF